MVLRVSAAAVNSCLRERLNHPIPNGVSVVILSKLTPLVETVIDLITTQAIEEWEQENSLREIQGGYILKKLRPEHFIKATEEIVSNITTSGLKPINSYDDIDSGGDESSEERESEETGVANSPHGGTE